MAKIIDNIRRVHKGFPNDPPKQAKLLLALKTHAVAATVGGIGSPAGRKYMSMFADSEEQLNLLTKVEDDPTRPWLHEAQAYLVANAMCAPSTNGQTGNGIFDTAMEGGIDGQLSTNVEDAVVSQRPADFKELF